MKFIEPIGGVWQDGMAEPESRSLKLHSNAGIDFGIVSVVVAMLEQTNAILVHELVAYNDGYELVVGDVLHHGADDAPGFLEQFLVVPMGIEKCQLVRNVVVLPQPQSVHNRQLQLFVGPVVARIEAVHVPATATSLTAAVRIAGLHGQQVFESYFHKWLAVTVTSAC